MVVRGVSLIENASQRLFQYGIDHGVMQAGHWNKKPSHPLQICSVDTLFRRKIVPPADLVVIDETHMAGSESYKWLLSHYQDKYILGVTATPHVKTGLRHVADHVVYPITMKELMDQGYLVRPKYFAPSKIDLSRVRQDNKTGDYNMADLAKAYDENISIYGDVVKAYKAHLDGAPSIAFAINKEHSRHLCQMFQSAGFSAVHIEDSTPMKERDQVMRQLESGEVNVVCNVGIWTVGVDIPCVRGIIMVRPTQSYNLYVQILGRGTRPFPGKDHFTILDHANNVVKHGFIEFERECDLDGRPPEPQGDMVPIICEQCYGAYQPERGQPKVCPHCGHAVKVVRGEAKEKVVDINFEMREIKAAKDAQTNMFVQKLIDKAIQREYKIGWIYYQLEKKYGKEEGKKIWFNAQKEAARQISARPPASNQSPVWTVLAQRDW